jgi:UDP-2,3-diacylglucosamine hydrolase
MPPQRPLGIIAGGGDLPYALYEAARLEGWVPYIIGFHDNLHFHQSDFTCSIGQVGRFFRYMRKRGIKNIVLCGTLKRPDFWKMRFDLKGICIVWRVQRLFKNQGGDDGLLRGLISILEGEGFQLPQPEEIAPTLLAPTGVWTIHRPTVHEENDIQRGWTVIEGLSALDIGQACVVNRKRVLAVEAIEGTEAMLQRIPLLPEDRRGALPSGVLVKRAKVGQDLRVDLPTIGPETVAQARAAGLRGIAVEAGRTYVLHQELTIAEANRAGLFLMGI